MWMTMLALACGITVAAAEPPAPVPAALLEHLTLQQAEIIFAERNRALLSARRIAEGAEADVLSAAAAPNPELSVGSARINGTS